jgi:hypothetical protein
MIDDGACPIEINPVSMRMAPNNAAAVPRQEAQRRSSPMANAVLVLVPDVTITRRTSSSSTASVKANPGRWGDARPALDHRRARQTVTAVNSASIRSAQQK